MFDYSINGFTADFNNNSTNSTDYNWNFGDGFNSTLQNPSHTYLVGGTYVVTLISSNANCLPDTISQTVTITSAPLSLFTVDENTGCDPFTANFTNLSQNDPESFSWTFTGGNPATSIEENPSVLYSNPGTYDVQLITSNIFGNDTLYLANYITVNTIPTPSFTETHSELSFSFLNTSIGATTFEWNFGDSNTSTEENPTHVYLVEGSYNVTLNASNECGSVVIPATITAANAPIAEFSSNTTEICPGEQAQYTDNSTGFGITRQWIFEGGTPATSTEISPLVTYQTSGNFQVTLIVSNASGNDTSSITNAITVKSLPTSFFTQQVNGLEIIAMNSSANATSFLWTLPDGSTSTSQDVTYNAVENGNYTFVLVATNDCGSTNYAAVVNLNALPVAEFNSDISSLGTCAPVLVQYNALANTGATYNWSFEGGSPASSTEVNPIITYQDSGSFDVVLIVSNTLGNDTITFDNYINLNDNPQSDYNFNATGGTINFEYIGETVDSVIWDFAGQGSSTVLNPQYTFTSSGSYLVTLISFNYCGNDTVTKNIEVIVSSTNDLFNGTIKIYPNPTIDVLNIESSKALESNYNLSITDLLGRTISKYNWSFGSKAMTISTDNLHSGSYLLKINNGKTTSVYSIVKQ